MSYRDHETAIRAGICLVLLMLAIPLASAVVDSATIPKSNDPDYNDRLETIATLKTHIADVSESQDVRMDATIRYINRISNGSGGIVLGQIHDDYLELASSVPLMQTYNHLIGTRDSLHDLSVAFSDETKTRMVFFNGSNDALRADVRAAVNASDEERSPGGNASHWLRNESARLTVFNQESRARMFLLRDLQRSGINITAAKSISDQIEAQRPGLVAALSNKSYPALQTTNDAIKNLNRQLREKVAGSRAAREIELKRDAMMAMG